MFQTLFWEYSVNKTKKNKNKQKKLSSWEDYILVWKDQYNKRMKYVAYQKMPHAMEKNKEE